MKKRAEAKAEPQARRRRLDQLVRRFITHPILCYSPSQILEAVQRDWDGPVGTSARAILDHMAGQHTTKCTVEFSDANGVFLEIDCVVRVPNPTGQRTGAIE